MTNFIEKLKRLEDLKLIDIVKNFRQYGYDDKIRNDAISILKERGVSIEELKMTGNFENKNYELANVIYNSFRFNSKVAFYLYGALTLSFILLIIISLYSESLILIGLISYSIVLISYILFLIKSFINQTQFYKLLKQDYGLEGALFYLLLGMPLYIFMYFYFRNQMKQKMKEII